MASNVSRRVTFSPTAAAPIPPAAVTTPALVAAMTTPAVTMVTALVAAPVTAPNPMHTKSCAVEFDKEGR